MAADSWQERAPEQCVRLPERGARPLANRLPEATAPVLPARSPDFREPFRCSDLNSTLGAALRLLPRNAGPHTGSAPVSSTLRLWPCVPVRRQPAARDFAVPGPLENPITPRSPNHGPARAHLFGGVDRSGPPSSVSPLRACAVHFAFERARFRNQVR